MVDMVVNEGCQQVVGQRYGVEIAREVQVDVLHRYDLRHAPACGTALHAKHRPQRRLAQRNDGTLSNPVKRITESHRGGGFPLACRCRADRGNQNQLAVRTPCK